MQNILLNELCHGEIYTFACNKVLTLTAAPVAPVVDRQLSVNRLESIKIIL